MIKRAIVAFTSVVGLTSAQNQNPGLTASLDIAVLQQAKDVYFDKILDIIRAVKVPDISFDEGHVNGNTFAITENSQNVNFFSDPNQNALVFSVADLAGEFKCADFKYTELYIFKASGSADVKMKNVSVTVGVQMTTQPGSEGRLLPAVAAVDVAVKIDKKGLDITLTGNYLTKLASWFEWFFEGTICSKVEDQLTAAIKEKMPAFLNDLILKSNGYATPVPFEKMTEFLTVDWSQFTPVQITGTQIQAGINGMTFDNRYPKVPVPGVTSIPMPSYDASQTEKVQAFANSYFVNNLFQELITENQDLTVTLDKTNMGFELTTTSINYALLGIKKFYGPDLPVSIDVKITKIEDFHVREADETMQAKTTANLKLYVHTADKVDLAVDLDVIRVLTNFTVIIDEMTLSGKVSNLNVEDLEANFCSYGTVHVDLLRKLIDDLLNDKTDVIETLNAYLAKNIVFAVPDSFGGVFKMSDLTLQYHDDYLFIGATPTFIAPAAGEKVDIFPTVTDEAYRWTPVDRIEETIQEVKEVVNIVEQGFSGLDNIVSIIRRHHLEEAVQA